MGHGGVSDMDGFELGAPALVCRWRLSHRQLLVENRHLRALLARRVNDAQVTPELVAWAKQHIEWNLDQGAAEHPDGVLMLIVDVQGRAAMTVGPFEPLQDTTLTGLVRRAEQALEEALHTGVAPETLWVACDDELVWDPGEGCTASGVASLVEQLAHTLGMGVRQWEHLADAMANGAIAYDEAFLVSDEHGVVVASDAAGDHGTRMARGYQRLLDRA